VEVILIHGKVTKDTIPFEADKMQSHVLRRYQDLRTKHDNAILVRQNVTNTKMLEEKWKISGSGSRVWAVPMKLLTPNSNQSIIECPNEDTDSS
jgi:hypothetical protein